MILRPQQVRMLACGLPATPANRSSSDSSSSSTQNVYQDRRNAVQGGVGVSGDGNSLSTTIVTTDQGAVQAGIGAAIAGIAGVSDVAKNANSSMAGVSTNAITASGHLADVGLAMLQANTALASQLEGGVNQTTQAVTGIASQLAQTNLAAQNDNRYLIAAGLAVVAIVGVMAFSKGKA
ncbi:hypothetical protein [Paraburkholderia kururiensis]|uniref:hypothetical protein n=1 Tax=Paraburkholderia kururiensis TaxID=984307 RepID=UPI0005A82DA8|nr:hypothetical protein [Paraburkholderia kururiensis]